MLRMAKSLRLYICMSYIQENVEFKNFNFNFLSGCYCNPLNRSVVNLFIQVCCISSTQLPLVAHPCFANHHLLFIHERRKTVDGVLWDEAIHVKTETNRAAKAKGSVPASPTQGNPCSPYGNASERIPVHTGTKC